MSKIKVTIENTEYTISNEGYYPLILFKRLTGKNYEGNEDIEEMLTLIYCYFKAYNKEFNYELDDFFQVANIEVMNAFNALNNSNVDEKKSE